MPGFNINGAGTGPSNTMEVGRKHRFSVVLTFATSIDTELNVKSVTLPSIEYDEMTAHNGADYILRPGKPKYKPIDIVFYEVLTGDNNESIVNKDIFKYLPNVSGEEIVSKYQKSDFGAGYGFTTFINRVDGNGKTYLTYTLYGCSIASYDPGDLSYADNELSEVKMSIRYNRFTQG